MRRSCSGRQECRPTPLARSRSLRDRASGAAWRALEVSRHSGASHRVGGRKTRQGEKESRRPSRHAEPPRLGGKPLRRRKLREPKGWRGPSPRRIASLALPGDRQPSAGHRTASQTARRPGQSVTGGRGLISGGHPGRWRVRGPRRDAHGESGSCDYPRSPAANPGGDGV